MFQEYSQSVSQRVWIQIEAELHEYRVFAKVIKSQSWYMVTWYVYKHYMKCQARSGLNLFDTQMVFLKEFFEKVDFEKISRS